MYGIYYICMGIRNSCCQVERDTTENRPSTYLSSNIDDLDVNITDEYDNPQRYHLCSNFLQTKVSASNNLLEKNFLVIQTSTFQIDTTIEDKCEASQKQVMQDRMMQPRLPSIKINYCDFIKTSCKKIEQNYRILKKIGQGAYGQVYKAQSQLTGDIRAIKKIKKQQIDRYRQEISILKQCDHPNIIQIFEVFEEENSVYVVMEYCEGGSIIQLIKQKKFQYLEEEAKIILEQILHALIYLHKKGIVHGDIKLENVVFIQPSPGQKITTNLKIIDFGCATRVKNNINRGKVTGGTTVYMAPQAFDGWHTKAFDIWSCGIMLYILLMGFSPFRHKNKQQVINFLKTKEIQFEQKKWKKISTEGKQLCKKMLNKNFVLRPTAEECLSSSWFKSYLKRSQTRRASEKFTKCLSKYYATNNFVSVVESYLSILKMSQSQKFEIKKLFQAIDINRQGVLTKDQLIDRYKQTSQNNEDKKLKQIIEAIDKNKSGSIDYSQFQALMCDREKLFIQKSLENAFDYFDVDGSGFIQRNELIKCLKECETDINELIYEIDCDADQKISKKEFIIYFRKFQDKMLALEKIQKIFMETVLK